MKKVLIISYFFPPCNIVASQRIHSWYRYLQQHGLYPVVITRHWNHPTHTISDLSRPDNSAPKIEKTAWGEVHYLPYRGSLRDRFMHRFPNRFQFVRKILSFFEQILPFISATFNPYKSFREYAEKLVCETRPEVLIISANPYLLFHIGYYLQKKYHLPWYADYRDDWTQNHTRKISTPLHRFILSIEKRAEKKYMGNVSGIFTVSEPIVKQISRRLGKKNVFLIENGAELEFYNNTTANPYAANSFTICYTGMMYDLPYMDIFCDGFLEFLRNTDNQHNIHVYFIGTEITPGRAKQRMLQLAEKLPSNIHILHKKPPEEIAVYQVHADVLLNLVFPGIIGTKIYNYAISARPILSVRYTEDNDVDFFPGRDIQYIANNAAEVTEFLHSIYKQKKQSGNVYTSITDAEKYRLSRAYNAEKLARIILGNEKNT